LTRRVQLAQERSTYLSNISLDDLLKKELFPTWEDYPPKKAKEGCQEIIRSLILALHGEEKPLSVAFVTQKLKECVEQLNQFDRKQKKFIETVERENLCEVLEEVACAAKCPSLVEKIDEWKDW